jgi:hypothetical protein
VGTYLYVCKPEQPIQDQKELSDPSTFKGNNGFFLNVQIKVSASRDFRQHGLQKSDIYDLFNSKVDRVENLNLEQKQKDIANRAQCTTQAQTSPECSVVRPSKFFPLFSFLSKNQ